MGFSVRVIGCGDAFGSGGQANTCFHVHTHGYNLLLDCGATSLPAMKQLGIYVEDLDCIILSHFHGDHFAGIPFLLLELAIYGQKRPLTIISPSGGEDKIAQLLQLLYPDTPVLSKLQVSFLTYNGRDNLRFHEIAIATFPVVHVAAAMPHAIRLTAGDKILAFSGDTEWTPELMGVADQADLFICECNFYDTLAKGHISYAELTSKLDILQFKKIVLTHFGHEMIHNKDKVKLPYCTAGQTIEV